MVVIQTPLELHEHNHIRCINQLPRELLSRIFIQCDWNTGYSVRVRPDRRDSQVDPTRYVQCVAPAVCRHWREVALATVALWTTIRIIKPLPCKRAELYLSRSGSTAPLDIQLFKTGANFVMEGDHPRTLVSHAEQVHKVFAFVVKHGGSLSRWSALRFMFLKPPPQLRLITMRGITGGQLFGDISRPQLAGLTSIFLSFVGPYPRVEHIYSMLAANPRLSKLLLDSIEAKRLDDAAITRVSSSPQLVLSSLVYLGFTSIKKPVWCLAILKMFKAPALETLQLSFLGREDPDANQVLVDYISHQGTQASPYFPTTLGELMFDTFGKTNPDPEPLLRAYPNIITIATDSFATLLKRPWLAPNLVNLRANIHRPSAASELKNIIFERCQDSLPLKRIYVWSSGGAWDPSPEDREQIEKLVELAGERVW
ncbi:unnamed protein product [Rhizoctonia solani]|uniref:F-box domain-containing protein n=1 Tax=Rhizoctonia solani TaxID=456999 RepID=A0A8H3H880_9AGAM|nr:unnamed protein product [Rhizoctonia solani]